MRWTYEDALRSCVEGLYRMRDGAGWGVSPGATASIVNTAEALAVLKAARDCHLPVDADVEREARDWLAAAVSEHCKPRMDGGRGEKTRYVTFALFGLVCEPADIDRSNINEATAWCLGWLEDRELKGGGWPEESGVQDPSIFQTALVVRTLAQLVRYVPKTGRYGAALDRARHLRDEGIQALLRHRLEAGAWPARVSHGEASPSKTSLALLALLEAWGDDSTARQQRYETSHFSNGPLVRTGEQIIGGGTDWLREHSNRWVHLVEADPDVTGTVWRHLTYALGVQALARASAGVLDDEFVPAWELIVTYWDADYCSWKEPASPPVPTVRATSAAVSALEELRRVEGTGGVRRMAALVASGRHGAKQAVDLVRSQTDQFALMWALDARRVDFRTLSPTEATLLKYLANRYGEPELRTVDQIRTALDIKPGSVGTYVRRLNRRIADETKGEVQRLVERGRRGGYQLAVARIVKDHYRGA